MFFYVKAIKKLVSNTTAKHIITSCYSDKTTPSPFVVIKQLTPTAK